MRNLFFILNLIYIFALGHDHAFGSDQNFARIDPNGYKANIMRNFQSPFPP